MKKGAKNIETYEKDFTFFSDKMIKNISKRPAVKLYLDSNKLKLVRFGHTSGEDGSYFAGLESRLTRSISKNINFKDVLSPKSILYQTCLQNINDVYVLDALDEVVKKVINMPTNYDLLFVVTTVSREVVMNGKKKTVDAGEKIGLLLIELGECKIYPNIPVLKIMCSLNVSPILMYTYLYVLKKMNINKGLLELAGCYHNMNGLCAYDRFGFVENYGLKNTKCFSEVNLLTKHATSLPMEINLGNVTFNDLDEVLHKRKRLGSEPLCDEMFKADDKIMKKQFKMIEERQQVYDNIIQDLLHKSGVKNVKTISKKGAQTTRNKKKGFMVKKGNVTRRRHGRVAD
tara:strand:- start:1651 stop:2682 length:1032 start_codon:yes stop_codon:yes gene_type:complete